MILWSAVWPPDSKPSTVIPSLQPSNMQGEIFKVLVKTVAENLMGHYSQVDMLGFALQILQPWSKIEPGLTKSARSNRLMRLVHGYFAHKETPRTTIGP